MKCLETRTTVEGFKRRRYSDDTGQRFTTIEVPIETWNQMQTAAFRKKAWHEKDSLRKQVISLYQNGWTILEILLETGISIAAVTQRIRKLKTPT